LHPPVAHARGSLTYRSRLSIFPEVFVTKLYSCVGPAAIAERARTAPGGRRIRSPDDVGDWIRATDQELHGGLVIATFVVDAEGRLLIADRRSEHVACAGGAVVRSAGEMTFAVGPPIEASAVSNQSTGYCPEPESWPAVAATLRAVGFAAPATFDPACHFRRCLSCADVTLVKNGVFECGLCGVPLPTEYNIQ
jgi:hypothetical protein